VKNGLHWKCRRIRKIKNRGDTQDLHKPYIDNVYLRCECGGKMKRTPEVFDCWFESGSMPYASWHYPFENKEIVEKTFPANFIAEGLDQTRGWFYTLHVIASALTLNNIGLGENNPAFQNVIVNGLVLDETGRKLSKKLRNYPDVNEIFEKYGADALRYFLLSSTNIGEDYRFSEDRVKEVWRKIILSFENCFTFYNTYKRNGVEVRSENI
jgi:isoleucyl-tRNA synthetase